MARFIYLGEPQNPAVLVMGRTLQIRCRCKDGTVMVLAPVPPATEFVPGTPIGHDVTDPRALRCMEADPRFQKIP